MNKIRLIHCYEFLNELMAELTIVCVRNEPIPSMYIANFTFVGSPVEKGEKMPQNNESKMNQYPVLALIVCRKLFDRHSTYRPCKMELGHSEVGLAFVEIN
jgi:hypothetical protein